MQMFTGLIQGVGEIVEVGGAAGPEGVGGAGGEGGDRAATWRVRVRARWDHRPEPGESIAINGCCLTVVGVVGVVGVEGAEAGGGGGAGEGQVLSFDAVPETLARTTLGALGRGDRVNLERSLRGEDLLGGHLVQGHVDGVGEVLAAEEGGLGGRRLRIGAGREVMELVTPKGSIAVNGVSLTVAACDRASFEVALIPDTLARTTLGALEPGARVNLETDILARTIIHWMKNWQNGER
jgi:riboflavin synthase